MKPTPPKSKPKRPCGRPVMRQIKLNATPRRSTQAIFKAGQKPNKRKP